MLEVVFYMFLAGCSDDQSLCQEIISPAVSYESADDCMFDLAAAVENARSDWPVTEGVCLPSSTDRSAARPDWIEGPDVLDVVAVASKSLH